MNLIINSFAKNLMNLAQRYLYGGRWENHRIEHGKKKDFHIGCNKERTISFWFSLQIRVFLKAQKKKRIYGTLINVAKWKYIYIYRERERERECNEEEKQCVWE